MAKTKIQWARLKNLPTERPLPNGKNYFVENEDGSLSLYSVTSDGEPKFIRGVSVEDAEKLSQLTVSLIDKLKEDYTKSQIDVMIESLEQAIADGVIQSTAGFVAPSGTVLPEPVTDNNFTIVGSESYTGGGGIPAKEGYMRIGSWDGSTWTVVGEVEMPTVEVTDAVEENNFKSISSNAVYRTVSNFLEIENTYINIPLTKSLGYWSTVTQDFVSDGITGTNSTQLIAVVEGDSFLITGRTLSSSQALISKFNQSGEYIGFLERGSAGATNNYTDYEYIADFTGFISVLGAVNSGTGNVSVVKKRGEVVIPKFYNKTEVDDSFQKIEDDNLLTVEKTIVGAINEIQQDLYSQDEIFTNITPTSFNSGYYITSDGSLQSDASWKSCLITDLEQGDILIIDGQSRPPSTQLIAKFGASGNYLGGEGIGTGTLVTYTNYEYVVPSNVKSIGITSLAAGVIKVVKKETVLVKKFISEQEADARYERKSNISEGVYGLVWDENDPLDLGTRVFDAEGLNAEIGIGNVDGQSDFDNIYPWSDMKRCNILVNSAGARIVTYEGESDFSLDGSNGDVFVEIPKCSVSRYNKDGLTYLTVSRQGNTHPAFIEKGKELDYIYVSAFEGSMYGGKYSSVAGLIPESNRTNSEFFNLCQDRGRGFSQFDMRTVDLLWSLMSVELGTRNSNAKLGYGLADFMQPLFNSSLTSVENSTGNVFKIPRLYPVQIEMMPVGTICTICETTQENIIAQRVITDITSDATYTYITFDGAPIVITTNHFIGSGGQKTNWTETCSSPLSWHTGRGGMSYSIVHDDTINPCRYRWIENPIGNLWHHLAGVTFHNGQMYVCDNIEDYEPYKITSPYRPVSKVFTIQNDNGNKNDIRDANFWIKNLNTDPFARGYSIGVNWDKTRVSTEGYGAYYYVRTGTMSIVHGGGFDHLWRCNMLTHRAWIDSNLRWYLYGSRLIFKPI